MTAAIKRKEMITRQRKKVEDEIAKYEKRELMEQIMRQNLLFDQHEIQQVKFQSTQAMLDKMAIRHTFVMNASAAILI